MKSFWYYLTGTNSEFSLESRIFHSFCVLAIITLAYCIPINLALNLPNSAIIALIALVSQSILYYLSRFKKKTRLSLILSIVIIHIVLIINYYFNSGINGPTHLILLAVFFTVIAVSKPESYKYWISLNIALAIALPLIEYYYPEFLINFYTSPLNHFLDIISSYFICSMLILIGLRYIKKNYYISQSLLEAKALDLERINQTKNKLFSIISHDLRAPIASLQSYLEILSQMDMEEENWQEIRTDLIQISQSTDNMLSNLLTWSKSQMEGIKLDKKLINLADALSPVIEVFHSVARVKQIELNYSINHTLKVLADEDMLQLVIRNILSNSIKFTHPVGRIDLEVTFDNLNYLIKISDTGIGMTESIQSSLFSIKAEPSYGTKNEKGVGLGLSLSKEFTELQGGKIWFESSPGIGTSFFLSMPIS